MSDDERDPTPREFYELGERLILTIERLAGVVGQVHGLDVRRECQWCAETVMLEDTGMLTLPADWVAWSGGPARQRLCRSCRNHDGVRLELEYWRVHQAQEWLQTKEGYCTAREWNEFCSGRGWSTESRGKGTTIRKLLELKMTRRGIQPDQVTYWCLPGVTAPDA